MNGFQYYLAAKVTLDLVIRLGFPEDSSWTLYICANKCGPVFLEWLLKRPFRPCVGAD
jgi:hypothetical protein